MNPERFDDRLDHVPAAGADDGVLRVSEAPGRGWFAAGGRAIPADEVGRHLAWVFARYGRALRELAR